MLAFSIEYEEEKRVVHCERALRMRDFTLAHFLRVVVSVDELRAVNAA